MLGRERVVRDRRALRQPSLPSSYKLPRARCGRHTLSMGRSIMQEPSGRAHVPRPRHAPGRGRRMQQGHGGRCVKAGPPGTTSARADKPRYPRLGRRCLAARGRACGGAWRCVVATVKTRREQRLRPACLVAAKGLAGLGSRRGAKRKTKADGRMAQGGGGFAESRERCVSTWDGGAGVIGEVARQDAGGGCACCRVPRPCCDVHPARPASAFIDRPSHACGAWQGQHVR